jgi:hypothetical protein
VIHNTGNMPPTRKRDTEPVELPRRSTRSRLSTSTLTSPSTSTANSRSNPPEKVKKMTIPIPPKEELRGKKAWERDFRSLKIQWKRGTIEGYGGLIASISGMSQISRIGAEARFQIW